MGIFVGLVPAFAWGVQSIVMQKTVGKIPDLRASRGHDTANTPHAVCYFERREELPSEIHNIRV